MTVKLQAARGDDRARLLSAIGPSPERATWRAFCTVDKWDPDQLAFAERRVRSDPAMGRRFCRHGGLFVPSGSDLALLVAPAEVTERAYNLLCNNGINRLLNLLIGTASLGTYANAIGRIGTGNGAGTAAAGDTDLSASAGSANRWFQAADSTFPSVASQTMTIKATFASGDGNYAWNEWGIDGGGASSNAVGTNGASTAALLNHKTSASLGTKASGAVWAFTATLVIS